MQAQAACLGQRCRLSVKLHHLVWMASSSPGTAVGLHTHQGEKGNLPATCGMGNQQLCSKPVARNAPPPKKQIKLQHFSGGGSTPLPASATASGSHLEAPRRETSERSRGPRCCIHAGAYCLRPREPGGAQPHTTAGY